MNDLGTYCLSPKSVQLSVSRALLPIYIENFPPRGGVIRNVLVQPNLVQQSLQKLLYLSTALNSTSKRGPSALRDEVDERSDGAARTQTSGARTRDPTEEGVTGG